MDWDAIGAIGEVVAALAVVFSLLYLARQVHQANTLAKGQTRQRMIEQAQQEVYTGFIDNPDIFKSFYKPEPLSEDEWIRLTGWILGAMRQREYEWFQYRDGNIDEALWKAYRDVMLVHLGTSRTRKWWETNGSMPFDKEFCAMVRELLDEHGETQYFHQFSALVAQEIPGPKLLPGSKTQSGS